MIYSPANQPTEIRHRSLAWHRYFASYLRKPNMCHIYQAFHLTILTFTRVTSSGSLGFISIGSSQEFTSPCLGAVLRGWLTRLRRRKRHLVSLHWKLFLELKKVEISREIPAYHILKRLTHPWLQSRPRASGRSCVRPSAVLPLVGSPVLGSYSPCSLARNLYPKISLICPHLLPWV